MNWDHLGISFVSEIITLANCLKEKHFNKKKKKKKKKKKEKKRNKEKTCLQYSYTPGFERFWRLIASWILFFYLFKIDFFLIFKFIVDFKS